MISSLKGTVAQIHEGAIEIEVGGVGYLVFAPASVMRSAREGKQVRVATHLAVREDSMTLYGFENPDERSVFQLLLTVTGVGPKLALAALSSLGTEALRRAVLTGDVAALTDVPGVGKRGASRMILELKDRLIGGDVEFAADSKISEVRDALTGLGYAPAELRDVLTRLEDSESSVEDLLKTALKELSRV